MEKLHEFYKYDRKLEVNSNSLVEFFTREGENIFADWRISWYDINEITYREDTRVGTSFLGFPLFFSGDQPSIIIGSNLLAVIAARYGDKIRRKNGQSYGKSKHYDTAWNTRCAGVANITE
jgi:hypothetical protein